MGDDDQLTFEESVRRAREAQAAADEAVARARANAHAEWRRLAYQAGIALARERDTFTSLDVTHYLLVHHPDATTHEPRALGAVMRDLARDGAISPTHEWIPSQLPGNHNRPVRVWSSELFER